MRLRRTKLECINWCAKRLRRSATWTMATLSVLLLMSCSHSNQRWRVIDLGVLGIERLSVPTDISVCSDIRRAEDIKHVEFCRGDRSMFSISVDRKYLLIFKEYQLDEERKIRSAGGHIWQVYRGGGDGAMAYTEDDESGKVLFFFGNDWFPREDAERIIESILWRPGVEKQASRTEKDEKGMGGR